MNSRTQAMIVLAASAVVVALIVGTASFRRPSPPQAAPYPTALACSDNRQIIQIHGTDSTGSFQPFDIVRGLDPSNPPPEVFADGHLNEEFRILVEGARADCLLTFSYDDIYLPVNGKVTPGVNAWNVSTSPWNRKPDELADYLQRLMDAYPPNVTFDIIAYSAGGVVPTYWAARERTTDAARKRVNSIIVVDGIVWGVDVGLDIACGLPLLGLRDTQIASYGRLPCQFSFADEYTRTVRTTDWWTKIRLSTVRARGDMIVWHQFAGLPGKTFLDPALRAKYCPFGDWIPQIKDCVLLTHGSVLEDVGARNAINQTLRAP